MKTKLLSYSYIPTSKTAATVKVLMRGTLPNAVEQLGAEAVHDREHHDERADAERDADQGEARDDRNEALAPGRPQVPPGDQALETTEGHQPAKRSSSSTGEI